MAETTPTDRPKWTTDSILIELDDASETIQSDGPCRWCMYDIEGERHADDCLVSIVATALARPTPMEADRYLHEILESTATLARIVGVPSAVRTTGSQCEPPESIDLPIDEVLDAIAGKLSNARPTPMGESEELQAVYQRLSYAKRVGAVPTPEEYFEDTTLLVDRIVALEAALAATPKCPTPGEAEPFETSNRESDRLWGMVENFAQAAADLQLKHFGEHEDCEKDGKACYIKYHIERLHRIVKDGPCRSEHPCPVCGASDQSTHDRDCPYVPQPAACPTPTPTPGEVADAFIGIEMMLDFYASSQSQDKREKYRQRATKLLATLRALAGQQAATAEVEEAEGALDYLDRPGGLYDPERFNDAIAQLRAFLGAARCGAGWSSIATAPKDGSRILLFVPSGYWHKIGTGAWSDKEYHVNGNWVKGIWLFGSGAHIEPTHWMPLPAPPAERSGG